MTTPSPSHGRSNLDAESSSRPAVSEMFALDQTDEEAHCGESPRRPTRQSGRHHHHRELCLVSVLRLRGKRGSPTVDAAAAQHLQRLSHPNIVRVRAIWETQPLRSVCVATDLCTNGTLRHRIKMAKRRNLRLKPRRVMGVFVQVRAHVCVHI